MDIQNIEKILIDFVTKQFGVSNPSPQSINGLALSIHCRDKRNQVNKEVKTLVALAKDAGVSLSMLIEKINEYDRLLP